VNRQITHLFLLFALMFAVLVGYSSWWSVIRADELEENTANRRPLLEEQRIPRGIIYASDGRTKLAESVPVGSDGARRFVRSYPEGSLFSHAIGYSFVERGRSGLEKSRNDELVGRTDEFNTLVEEITGGTAKEGDDVRTTLDPEAQRTALAALAGRPGSIVALEPQTGRVRVMASLPDFDPNDVPGSYSELNRQEGSPIFNRATQARYPPGSTFKVVTAAAALDSGEFTPDSVLDGNTGKTISGVPLENFGGQDFGPTTLTDALTNSVNTVWAQVGEQLGKDTMFDYMERFGFNDEPPIDYPPEQLTASGEFAGNDLLGPKDDTVDVGRMAIGQDKLQVTPLQMAMVAGAVANDGRLMKPRLIERVVSRDGRVQDRVDPAEAAQVMKPESARALGAMMARVVEEGSGTAAALAGTPVAGKTGTAEVQSGAANQPWFIAFAPIEDPQIAVAVTLESRPPDETGGQAAAPLAKQVIEQVLSGG